MASNNGVQTEAAVRAQDWEAATDGLKSPGGGEMVELPALRTWTPPDLPPDRLNDAQRFRVDIHCGQAKLANREPGRARMSHAGGMSRQARGVTQRPHGF